ncbi:MAG: hypothetical protein VYC88_11590 [SAR324 cluster bacterium]|nr:hypothetical protein [SAR324 cluster bacterium]
MTTIQQHHTQQPTNQQPIDATQQGIKTTRQQDSMTTRQQRNNPTAQQPTTQQPTNQLMWPGGMREAIRRPTGVGVLDASSFSDTLACCFRP